MSARSARRAAERHALKAAPQPGTQTISPAQLAANRANAQLSSGPSSPEGKLKLSHNALKTGLTGRTILLPADDVAAYQSLVALINQKFSPATGFEKHLARPSPTLNGDSFASPPSKPASMPSAAWNSRPIAPTEPPLKPSSSVPIKRISEI